MHFDPTVSKDIADLSRSAANADHTFRQIVARLCERYEAETGRVASEEMKDWEVQFRVATDPKFAQLNRTIVQFRYMLLGF